MRARRIRLLVDTRSVTDSARRGRRGQTDGNHGDSIIYIVAIGWMFVVVCMSAVEATTSLAGAAGTLLLYGLLPLALFLWLAGTPQRHRDRGGTRGVRARSGASFERRGHPPREEEREGDDA